jgi:signal transduction histidine kinase
MVAGIAHEVNNPVGISLTVASTLQQKAALFSAKASSGELRRSSLNAFLELVRDAASQLVTNLSRSAERIQSFKQVALDQSQLKRRSFDAGELASQVLSHLLRDSEYEAIKLEFHGEQGLLMESYPGPFGQMLTHLVRNAVTHAFPERLSGAVDIRMAASGLDHVEVSVVDNGCGMTPDIRRMAFDPFFTTRRNHGAAGLGLHIVHTIVTERLGGRIILESEPSGGTSVSLILPRIAP